MLAPTTIVPRPDADVHASKTASGATVPPGLLPLHQLIDVVTVGYLADLDRDNLPAPSVIEHELLVEVNDAIEYGNAPRLSRNKIRELRSLTFSQIGSILVALHHAVRITPERRSDPSLDVLGIYVPSGPDAGTYATETSRLRAIARLYNDALTTNEWKEIEHYLLDAAPVATVCADRDLLAVGNGVFNYGTKQLEPFDPSRIFTTKIPVSYVAGAVSPVITHPTDGTVWDVEGWMRDLSDDPEIVELLWQIIGAVVRPHVRWNKTAWFYSERGNNGKGTQVELMRNLLGPSAASVPLADFGKDFLLEPLLRASAILVDENDVGAYLDRAANLKAVVTNDVISINRKNLRPIAYQFWGFMVQCVNELPRMKDKSDSLYRRLLMVPFTKTFTGRERRYIKDDYLARPEVLEYVLHRVLHMPDYYTLSEPQACLDLLGEQKLATNPVEEFWAEFSGRFAWNFLPFPFLHGLYVAWLRRTNPSGHPVSSHMLTKELTRLAHAGEIWACPDPAKKSREAARMSGPEPLIGEYDLEEWVNPTYRGATHPAVKSTPGTHKLQAPYRGLTRVGAAPAAAAVSTTGPTSVTPVLDLVAALAQHGIDLSEGATP